MIAVAQLILVYKTSFGPKSGVSVATVAFSGPDGWLIIAGRGVRLSYPLKEWSTISMRRIWKQGTNPV